MNRFLTVSGVALLIPIWAALGPATATSGYVLYGLDGELAIDPNAADVAIEQAFADLDLGYVGTASQKGGRVRVLAGAYTIDSTIDVPSHVEVECDEGTVFRRGSSLSGPCFSLGQGAVLSGATFDLPAPDGPAVVIQGAGARLDALALDVGASTSRLVEVHGEHAQVDGLAFDIESSTAEALVVQADYAIIRGARFSVQDPTSSFACVAVLGADGSPSGVAVRGRLEGCHFESGFTSSEGQVDFVLARFAEALSISGCTFLGADNAAGVVGRAIALEDAPWADVSDNYFRWLTADGDALVQVGLPDGSTAEGHHSSYTNNTHENIFARYCLLLEGVNFDSVEGNRWGRIFATPDACTNGVCEAAVIKTDSVPGVDPESLSTDAYQQLSITDNLFHSLSSVGLKSIDLEYVTNVNVQGVSHVNIRADGTVPEVSVLVRDTAKDVLVGERSTCVFARYEHPAHTQAIAPACWEPLAMPYVRPPDGNCP